MAEWINERTHGCIALINGWRGYRIDELMCGWMDKLIYRWMDECIDGWTGRTGEDW
jgi:hypothetical protein